MIHLFTKKVMGRGFGGRRRLGKTSVDGRMLLGGMPWNWKAAARKAEDWRKVAGEAMARKRTEAPWEKKKEVRRRLEI
jgi:hypothetical protein